VDLVTASSLSGTRLFLNEPGSHHWLKVQLRGKTANRFGVGARVEVYAEGRQQVREITAGNGMVAQNHNLTAHFGLGTSERIDSLVVRWPGGSVDRMADLTVDQHTTVVENSGLNNPPDAFRLLAPTDETVLRQDAPFLFEWEAASDEEDDALTYTLYLMSPEDEMVFEGLHEPRAEVDLDDLPPHQTYYWSVDVTDGHSIRRSVDRFQLMLDQPTATENPAEVPELRLHVYPNPFHETATLRITLPEPTDIIVQVYDLMGRAVRKLAAGRMVAGDHAMQWDGRNDSGIAVAPGLYVYRVQTPQNLFTTSVIRLP